VCHLAHCQRPQLASRWECCPSGPPPNSSPTSDSRQGSEDLCVRGWDTRQSNKQQPSIHLTGFQYFPLCLAIDESQPLLAAGCKGFNGVGCDIKVWDVRFFRPGKFLSELSGHQQDVTCCSLLPNSSSPTILTGSRDSTLKCWSLDANDSENHTSAAVVTTFSDRSSYNCLDSWHSEEGLWLSCLGDMDGSVSVLSLKKGGGGKIDVDLVWKSAPYIPPTDTPEL
jgi:WD40 repeat protein